MLAASCLQDENLCFDRFLMRTQEKLTCSETDNNATSSLNKHIHKSVISCLFNYV